MEPANEPVLNEEPILTSTIQIPTTTTSTTEQNRLRRTRVQTVSKNITGYGVLINENMLADTKIIPTIVHKSAYKADELKSNSFIVDFEKPEEADSFFKEVGHSSFVFIHNVNSVNEQAFIDCRNANKEMFLKYIRRSCRPNCYFKSNDSGSKSIDLYTYIDLCKNSELFIPVDRSVDFLNAYLKNLHQKIEKGQVLDTYPKNPFTNPGINCASDNENLTPYIKTLKCNCQEEDCILFQIQTALTNLCDRNKKQQLVKPNVVVDGEKKPKKKSSESQTDSTAGALSREDRKLQYLIKMIDKMEKSTEESVVEGEPKPKMRRKRSSPVNTNNNNNNNDNNKVVEKIKKTKKTSGESVRLFEYDPKCTEDMQTVLLYNKFDSISLLYSSPRMQRYQRIRDLTAAKKMV